MNQNQNYVLGLNPKPRSESFGYYSEQNYTMMEKRQLFLRSYQFCRKRSLSERLKGSFIRVKRVICFRLRSARRFRKLFLSSLSQSGDDLRLIITMFYILECLIRFTLLNSMMPTDPLDKTSKCK
uniref:Uncharacterized protein n=1 Tax=Quercus lobata TaxID=97700 RepID=A0A7N2L5D8_QUELO